MNLKLALAGALALALHSCGMNPAYAFDDGRWNGIDPKTREWFKSVRSPAGIPCCDIADGHRTTWRGDKDGGYEVPIADRWIPIPPETVIHDAGNPTGDAIVWYSVYPTGEIHVRCFVPGNGA